MKLKSIALAILLAGITPAFAQDPFSQTRIDWNKPYKPFRVIANVYYVGMAGVSAFLIVTPKGDILTDGGLPESAPQIEKNIQALGFKLRDVKILLNSHAHFDHAGGLAKLKADTGAHLYASAQDRPFLESGHITFGPSIATPFPPVKVDHVVADGDTVSLGGVTLTANITPGHTPGCTTWTMPLTDAGTRHKMMFFCSISVAGNPLTGSAAYPAITDDYKKSFARLDKMDADVFLAPHGGQFGLDAKVAKMKPGAPNPFVDAGELRRFLREARKDYDAELAKQFAAKANSKRPEL
ncbi:MAG TPA: subclass B3 metallo-beta-lactamase [Rhizomicrobium sp.]|jgi:metallo-beta-lactamase class B